MVYGKGKVFEVKQPDDTTLNRDGYVGTDPIYQNHANETDAPLGEEGDLAFSTAKQEEDEKADADNVTASSHATGVSEETGEEKREANAEADAEADDSTEEEQQEEAGETGTPKGSSRKRTTKATSDSDEPVL